MHVGVYALMFLSWSLSPLGYAQSVARLGGILAAVITLGAFLEYIQLAVPGRFGSLYDIGLNTFGALAGVLSLVAIQSAKEPGQPPA